MLGISAWAGGWALVMAVLACVTSNASVPHLGVFLSSKLLLLCKVVLFLAQVLVWG